MQPARGRNDGLSPPREGEASGGDYVSLNVGDATGYVDADGLEIHVPHAAFQCDVLGIRSRLAGEASAICFKPLTVYGAGAASKEIHSAVVN